MDLWNMSNTTQQLAAPAAPACLDLTDNDIVRAEEDLPSWILDDLYQQDFCFGAKDIHSLTTGSIEECQLVSELMNDPSELKAFTEGNVKNSLKEQTLQPAGSPRMVEYEDPNDIIREEINQHLRQQQLQYMKELQDQESIENKDCHSEYSNEAILFSSQTSSPNANYLKSPTLSPSYNFDETETIKFQINYADPIDTSITKVQAPVLNTSPSVSASNIVHNVQEIAYSPVTCNVPVTAPQVYTIVKQPPLHNFVIKEQIISQPKSKQIPRPIQPQPSSKKNRISAQMTLEEALASDDFDDLIKNITEYVADEAKESETIGHSVEPVSDESCEEIAIEKLENSVSFVIDEVTEGIEVLPGGSADEDELSDVIFATSDMSDVAYSPGAVSQSSGCSGRSSASSSRRYAPYTLNERKVRKKEQNKQAALRYRQKKKKEEVSTLTLLEREEERQRVLKAKFDELHSEVKYLKKFMKEMLLKKKLSNM